jgi:hypothetical protein
VPTAASAIPFIGLTALTLEPRGVIMKKNFSRFLVVSLLLPGLAIGKHKEDKIDPRLKQIHTIFLKGAYTALQEVRDKRAEIEKDSCLRFADHADSADAVVKVSYRPGGVSQVSTATPDMPGMGLQDVQPYHTALELSVGEGTKMRKIWDKHVDLDRGQQATQPGVLRLMDFLRHDACDGR